MQSLAAALAEILQRRGLEPTLAGWRAVEEWPGVVGPRIASRSRAVRFQDGVLLVEVDGSAWMHELGFLKRDILKRLGERLGAKAVRELRFVLTRGGIRR